LHLSSGRLMEAVDLLSTTHTNSLYLKLKCITLYVITVECWM